MTLARRRSCVLECVEAFRRLNPSINMSQLTAFLYIAENEGLSISELACLLATTRATASRTARSLLPPASNEGLAPFLGLVSISSEKGVISKSIVLSEDGRRLRDRLDEIIASAEPIRGRAAPAVNRAA